MFYKLKHENAEEEIQVKPKEKETPPSRTGRLFEFYT